MMKQWNALNEYCRNGWVEIDNNLCENALRVVALGHRNYMFFGSDGGGDSAAVMYKLQTQRYRAGSLATSHNQRH